MEFIVLHNIKGKEWFINMRQVVAMKRTERGGTELYLMGDQIPIAVQESIEDIKNILTQLHNS